MDERSKLISDYLKAKHTTNKQSVVIFNIYPTLKDTITIRIIDKVSGERIRQFYIKTEKILLEISSQGYPNVRV